MMLEHVMQSVHHELMMWKKAKDLFQQNNSILYIQTLKMVNFLSEKDWDEAQNHHYESLSRLTDFNI